MSSMPPVPVMVLRMTTTSLSSRSLQRRRRPMHYTGLARNTATRRSTTAALPKTALKPSAIGRRKISHDLIDTARFFDEHAARRQVPHVVVHVHHRIHGARDGGRVRIGRSIDPVVRIEPRERLEETPLVDVAREVDARAQREPHVLGFLA